MKKGPLFVCLGYIGNEILPSYVGIIINHHKDPHETTVITESNAGFFSWLKGLFSSTQSSAGYRKALKTIARIGQSDDGEESPRANKFVSYFFWRGGDESKFNKPNLGVKKLSSYLQSK